MPQISQKRLNIRKEQELLLMLHTILANISKTAEMESFLFSFLTPTEQLMLAKRLAIILLLKERKNDTEISNLLNVTRITVAKLRYLVEARPESFDITTRILRNEELDKVIKQTLLELGAYLARSAGGRIKI